MTLKLIFFLMSHEMYFQMIITSKLFSALRPKADMIFDFIVNVFMFKESLFLTETSLTSGPFTAIGLFSRMNSQMMFQMIGRLKGWLTSGPLAQIWSPIVMRSSFMYFQSRYRIETALTLSPIALKRLIARMSHSMILQILVVMGHKITSIPIALIFNQWMNYSFMTYQIVFSSECFFTIINITFIGLKLLVNFIYMRFHRCLHSCSVLTVRVITKQIAFSISIRVNA
jgi:hypothetical protein